MLLALPSLWVGWQLDDYIHRSILLAHTGLAGLPEILMGLFVQLDGVPIHNQKLMDIGVLPWWSLETLQLAFWRPLTALTHWFDYVLWPNSAVLMHLQSLIWFGTLVAVITLFYRRLAGPTVLAGLAALLYAIDDAHGFPVGYLANRNALLSTILGVMTLITYERWRRVGWRPGALLAPFLLALALLAKESAVATLAYLFSYALFLDSGSWRQRLLALLPCFLTFTTWWALYQFLNFGSFGAINYLDPAEQPLRFLDTLFERAPILLLGQWGWPPSDYYLSTHTNVIQLWWFGAVTFLIGLTFTIWPLIRQDKLARFWAVGMLLSLVPSCIPLPSDRLLFFVGLGAMGLLAQFLVLVWSHPPTMPSSRLGRTVTLTFGIFFVVLHLIVAPLLLPARSWSPRLLDEIRTAINTLPIDANFANQDAVIVNAPSFFHTSYIPILRQLNDQPTPSHTRLLATGTQSIELHRSDHYTVVLRPENGYLLALEQWVRDPLYTISHGHRISLTGLEIEVTSLTEDSRPAEVQFRFSVPLEDKSLRWLKWKNGNYVAFTPPGVGEKMTMSPINTD